MATWVLDTTVLVDAARGRPGTVARIRSLRPRGDVVAASPISVDELVRGALPREEDQIAQLIDGLVVLPIRRQEAELAGTWRREFSRQGITLGQPDCLIAAAAKIRDLVLATGNVKDFPMEGLRVEHWPSGE
jgi:predicted nucleic acid-binding protein